MKKKIFSALLVFVLLCMPMFCLTGCGSDPGADTHFTVSTTDLGNVEKGTSFASLTTLTVQMDYQSQKWNQEMGEWQYVVKNSKNDDGSTLYDFAGTNAVWFYGNTAASTEAVSIATALNRGMQYSGWNTSTVSSGTRTVTLTFGGISHKVTYTVVDNSTPKGE